MNWRALLPSFGPRIEGFVDRVIASEIIGWAYDPARPEGRVLVVARRDGQVVAETLADLPRRDLMSADKGDGRHGFRLRIPASLEDGVRHELRVEAQVGRRRTRLQNGDVSFFAEPRSRRLGAGKPESKQPNAGFLERAADGVLTGWAVNPYDPDPPAALDVFDDEVFLGGAVADIARPRLLQTGAPAGARGFQFELPDEVDADAIDRLRVRIVGTYLDLRRSKTYPGDAGGGEHADERPDQFPAAPTPRRTTAIAAPRRSAALLVCGGGERAASTLRSWAEQGGGETCAAQIEAKLDRNSGAGIPAGMDFRRFGAGDERALREFFGASEWVVLAAAGDALAPGMAASLLNPPLAADVAAWGGREAPEIDVLMGRRLPGAFAVRGGVLEAFEGPLAKELSGGRLQSLALALAADPGLRWESLGGAAAQVTEPADEDLKAPAGFRRSTGHGQGPPAFPGRGPRRLSLAVWSGWGAAPPPALATLFAGCKGLDLEVLVPDGRDFDGLEAQVRGLAGRGPASLTVRPVEAPASGGQGLLWRRLCEAASAEVVVLCHGDVTLADPAALAEVVAWPLDPRVGAVTVEIAGEGDDAILAGLAIDQEADPPAAGSAYEAALGGRARVVTAAPAAFMAVSRAALARVGGFDARRFVGDFGDLDLGLRLAAAGQRNLLLGHLHARAPSDLAGLGPPHPLPPEIAALLRPAPDRKAAA